MVMVVAMTDGQDWRSDHHTGAKASMSARWPAGGGARVLQVTRLAWPTGGEEGKIMKEELEVGKECQMIMPSWAKKERMDVHGGRQQMGMQFQQNGHDGR
jgi:hypothetical protein